MSSHSTPSGPGPAWRRRALAIGLGVVLVPLLFELGLRVGSLFVERARAASGAAFVLCQGDSNTYGLNLAASEAYPSALEALLRERGVADAEVVNRGVPGKASWILANELEHDLQTYAPRVVVVLVGVNDRNQLRPDDELARLLEGSRFVRMVRRTLSNVSETAYAAERPSDDPARPPTTPAIALRFGRPDDALVDRWTREELRRIVERVRASGATPFLMTYFDVLPSMHSANAAAEDVARETGAKLVDLRAAFAPAFDQVGRDALEFDDAHLRAVGNRILARVLFNALVEEHLIDAAPIEDVLEPLGSIDLRLPRVTPWRDGDAVRGVEIRFQPGLRAQLLLSRQPGATALRFDGTVRRVAPKQAMGRLPLRTDDVLDASLRAAAEFTRTLDDGGEGRIALPPDAEAVTSLWASIVFVDDEKGLVAVSNALRLR
ncbi:MAG: hypothetical protein HZA52_19485 [Planctomycetes bacterium]|nr:hypothetical protein [Planctomycetota bacterium]